MGAAGSSVCRPFMPGEFAVAWLTFKGDSVENSDHRYVAKKDGLLSSKLLLRLYGEATIKCFADEEGDFVSREMFVCTLALCYEGNTEDRISYIFTMYSIIYGLQREGEGCMVKRDYMYLLEYLEGFNFIPKQFYTAFDECQVPPNGMLRNSQFVEWVRKYPVLLEFLASHLPPAVRGLTSPISAHAGDDFGKNDPLNNSPSCRERTKSGGSPAMFDFIGGEDSGDDSDEAYDSDHIFEMEEFGAFQSAAMVQGTGDDYDRSSVTAAGSDRSDCEDSTETSTGPTTSENDPPAANPSGSRRQRGSRTRGVHKMGRNLTRTLGGGISKVGYVGRTILHGGKGSSSDQTQQANNEALLGAGYAFSSESQISKNYVCGYLHKISDGKWSKRSWHRRWFVLDRQQGILSYYRHNPANHITATPRGNIVHMNDENETANDLSKDKASTDVEKPTTNEASVSLTSPRHSGVTQPTDKAHPQQMLYLNKSHPWYRGELNLNNDNVSLLFEKSLARNAPTKYFFQVSTLSLQEIDSKRGTQYKLCAESEEEFDQWTLAIAAAINRKHTEQKAGPTLSHQQLYRQKLLQEQQRQDSAHLNEQKKTTEEQQKQPNASSKQPNGDGSTGRTGAESVAEDENLTESAVRVSRSRPTPPPIITYSPPQSSVSSQSQWRLQVSIEGSKQCMIVGFMMNMIALKCVSPDYAISKLLLCIIVTTAYVASVYNPNPVRTVPPTTIQSGALDATLLGTEPLSSCRDPSSCCLHKIPVAATANISGVMSEPCTGAEPVSTILPPVGGFTKFPLGISMKQTETNLTGKAGSIPQSWTTTRAETFQIRCQDYKKSKRKEPSKAALFEFIGADLLRTDRKVDLISQRLDLPEKYANDKVFIINAQLPSYGPSVWGGDTSYDGPGFTLILCWRIPPDICEELKDPKSKELRLFKRFQNAGSDTSLTDRFKVIAQVANQDECGLTGMAKKLLVSHNATPVLTRPQHRIYHFNEGSTEIVVDIHSFSYIARRGIHMLLDKTSRLVIDIAFVLQGETEVELPERILGCCRLDSVDVSKAMDLPQ